MKSGNNFSPPLTILNYNKASSDKPFIIRNLSSISTKKQRSLFLQQFLSTLETRRRDAWYTTPDPETVWWWKKSVSLVALTLERDLFDSKTATTWCTCWGCVVFSLMKIRNPHESCVSFGRRDYAQCCCSEQQEGYNVPVSLPNQFSSSLHYAARLQILPMPKVTFRFLHNIFELKRKPYPWLVPSMSCMDRISFSQGSPRPPAQDIIGVSFIPKPLIVGDLSSQQYPPHLLLGHGGSGF